jgi:golgi to ER traffic protein 4
LRVIAARYTKAENWDTAIDILYNGSLALLKAGQGGSGGDLARLLVETLIKGEVHVSVDIKGLFHTHLDSFLFS